MCGCVGQPASIYVRVMFELAIPLVVDEGAKPI